MNRKHLLIAIAAVALAGIGVGLLLPALEGGPLTGSIAPTDDSQLIEMPPPPAITVTGTVTPYRSLNSNLNLYEWCWHLHSVITYDASHLPPGVGLQQVAWTIAGTLPDGRTHLCVSNFMLRSENWELPVTDTITVDEGFRDFCIMYGGPQMELCPASRMYPGPPFTATCTLTTTTGSTYTQSAQLVVNI